MEKETYKYFISFYSDGGDINLYGNIELNIKLIESIDDIREIEEDICKDLGFVKVTILNYRMF